MTFEIMYTHYRRKIISSSNNGTGELLEAEGVITFAV